VDGKILIEWKLLTRLLVLTSLRLMLTVLIPLNYLSCKQATIQAAMVLQNCCYLCYFSIRHYSYITLSSILLNVGLVLGRHAPLGLDPFHSPWFAPTHEIHEIAPEESGLSENSRCAWFRLLLKETHQP
jgi:hypothetical protein